jgi:hypothetical protein
VWASSRHGALERAKTYSKSSVIALSVIDMRLSRDE